MLTSENKLRRAAVKEMQRHQKYLEKRMTRLRREALRLIAGDSELDRRFRLMLTTTGIAETSALQILGELAVLPDMLDARQWVAFSGLDPRLIKSGKSVEKRPRISRGGSRHLRRALYTPALVALRRDPYLQGFYQNLLARGKARMQAVVAIMRKLLHALFATFLLILRALWLATKVYSGLGADIVMESSHSRYRECMVEFPRRLPCIYGSLFGLGRWHMFLSSLPTLPQTMVIRHRASCPVPRFSEPC
jgi:hypothetical protein